MIINGLAVLDKGSTLGGGALKTYLVNSNTNAVSFTDCMYRIKVPKKRSKSGKAAYGIKQ